MSKLEADGLVAVKTSRRGKRLLAELSITPARRRELAACRRRLAMAVQELPEPTVALKRK